MMPVARTVRTREVICSRTVMSPPLFGDQTSTLGEKSFPRTVIFVLDDGKYSAVLSVLFLAFGGVIRSGRTFALTQSRSRARAASCEKLEPQGRTGTHG